MAVELRPGRERPGKGFFGKAPAGAKSEATAGWERPIVTALHAAGIALSRANPRQVRDFARGCGQRAKTDAIDTQVLAAFGAANAPAATPAPDAQQAGLSAWVTRREQLQGMLVAERARLIPGLPKAVAADLAASVDGLEKHLAQVVARLAAPLAESAEIGGRAARLCLIRGWDPARRPPCSATGLNWARSGAARSRRSQVWLPCRRQRTTARAAPTSPGAASAGVARSYMAAFNACRCDPVLKAFYQRLRAAGKPCKAALIATARQRLCNPPPATRLTDQ